MSTAVTSATVKDSVGERAHLKLWANIESMCPLHVRDASESAALHASSLAVLAQYAVKRAVWEGGGVIQHCPPWVSIKASARQLQYIKSALDVLLVMLHSSRACSNACVKADADDISLKGARPSAEGNPQRTPYQGTSSLRNYSRSTEES